MYVLFIIYYKSFLICHNFFRFVVFEIIFVLFLLQSIVILTIHEQILHAAINLAWTDKSTEDVMGRAGVMVIAYNNIIIIYGYYY